MKTIFKVLLVLAALLPIIRLTQDGASSILIFSVFVVVFIWKGLQRAFAKIPLPLFLYYIFLGTLFGGLTQYFVQLEGFEKSFSANPTVHFFQALTIYFWVVVVWYLLLRKYNFSVWDVFWVTGIWGVVVEAIIIYGSLNPLVWFFIFVVYGSFASIPYILTQTKFSLDRKPPSLKIHLLAFCLLVLALFVSKLSIVILALAGIK